MGRHSSGQGMGWTLPVAVLAVVAAVAAVLVAARQDSTVDRVQGAAGTSACSRVVNVTTATSFAPVLRSLAPALEQGDDCVRVRLSVADGRGAADTVAAGTADAWIPDDAAWGGMAPTGLLAEEGVVDAGAVVATSPIYMVTDQATAGRVRAAGQSWWGLAQLATTPAGVKLAVRDPAGSGDGMVAAGDLAEAVWLQRDMDVSAMVMASAVKHTRTVMADGVALPRASGEVGLVPEYALLRSPEVGPRVLLTGRDNTAMLRFSWWPTAAAAGRPERLTALRRVLAELRSPRGLRALEAAKLRPADGSGPPSGSPAGLPDTSAPPFPVLKPHHVDHVFATWYARDRLTDIHVVIDVSGSMGENAPGTRTPLISLVRQGLRGVGDLLPDDARVGLWTFGSRLDGPRDYRRLIPIDRMMPPHRAAVRRASDKLAAERTGTGLYDTILAAYTAAVHSYRPGVLNQVIVFTDGRNEDDPGSISPEQLRSGLLAARREDRPVELSVIAFGSRPEAGVVKAAIEPIDGYLDAIKSADEVAAVFVHVTAGGPHD